MAGANAGGRPYAPRMPAGQREQQLLDVTQRIALDCGFHAVTVEGVARLAGVTRPVIYGLFADRGQLLAALVARAEVRARAQLLPALPAVPGPEEYLDPDALLADALTAYLSAVRADPDTWRVILLPPEGAPGELTERLAAGRREVMRSLRELAAWGLARRGGSVRDVDLLTFSMLGLAEGAARLLLHDETRYPVERFRTFTEQLLAGLS